MHFNGVDLDAIGERFRNERETRFDGSVKDAARAAGLRSGEWKRIEKGLPVAWLAMTAAHGLLWPDDDSEWWAPMASDALRLDTSGPALGSSGPQQWAVARLDNGAEVRMRACGDRVEIRTWDETESCNPPALDVDRIGSHVIDVRVPTASDTAADVYVVETSLGMTESFSERQINTLVSLGLIEHERDGHVMETSDGSGVGPVHHFYRAVR